MKTLKLSERYLLSKRNLNYSLKLLSELERYYYDPVFDDINNAAYVVVTLNSNVFPHGNVDYIYARDLSSARRIASIYKKLFSRIPDYFFYNIRCNQIFFRRVRDLDPSSVCTLSSRLLNNDHDNSVIFRTLHFVKLNFLTRLNRLPNGI